MYAVDIRMTPGELSRQMSEMRVWLDERRFEPSTFYCHNQSFGMLVSVEFRAAQEAEATKACSKGCTHPIPFQFSVNME